MPWQEISRATLAKGRTFAKPVSFQGGVAANVGMRKAFQEVLELSDGELIIPKYFASMGAIGAVLVTLRRTKIENGQGPGSRPPSINIWKNIREEATP